MKKQLDNWDLIMFKSEEDGLFIWKSKHTGQYIAEFNAKAVFGYKTFSSFLKELTKWVTKYNLKRYETNT